ncbi:MAG TPA: glyoxalase superfamily protein [Candidatus Acidoferrum sp.]|nr:glyoxalase superfamily protein [Candidatus Acidoferrum sp.]
MPEPKPKAAIEFKMACPQFIVPDVVAAAEYYREKLGFQILSYFLDPPVFAMVARGGVEIHFGKSDGEPPSPNHIRRKGLGLDAYVWVSDVDSLYQELGARGVKILEPPARRVYKCYEMVIEDNFGFRVCFSQDLSSADN